MRTSEMALLLPDVVRRTAVTGSPMAALLAVMEAMHAPAEQAIRGFGDVLDPLVAPEGFVPMLARWVDLERLDDTPAGRLEIDRLRLLVHLAEPLARRRGTAAGLLDLLTVATGVTGWLLTDVGPFHVALTVPPAGSSLIPLITEIVDQEKPAALVIDVVMAS